MTIDQLPGRNLYYQGEEWLYFAGTAYLGIPHDAVFRQWLLAGFDRYGHHYGGSRLAQPELKVFAEAEARLALRSGAEAALVVSSGTLAGQLAVRVLSGRGNVRIAPGAHPAIRGAEPGEAGRFTDWLQGVLQELRGKPGPLVLFANAFDPLEVREHPFQLLGEVPADVPVTLVLDDSHGLGVTGVEGGGIATTLALPDNIEWVVVSSLGKALGLPGGVILGRARTIAAIRAHPLFGGAAPPPPAYLYAFLQAEPDHYRRQRRQLRAHLARFRASLPARLHFRHIPDFPVFSSDSDTLTAYLARERLLLSSFPYPTAQSPLLHRIVLTSAHEAADIERLLHHLACFAETLPE